MPAAERGVGETAAAHTALLFDAALVLGAHALHASTCSAISPLAITVAERGVGEAAVAHTALLLDVALVLGTHALHTSANSKHVAQLTRATIKQLLLPAVALGRDSRS